MQENPIPIIAIDGTSSSGKGTVAYKLAHYFGFHYLNSGALYRLTAYEAIKENIDLQDVNAVALVAEHLSPLFEGKQVIVQGENIWPTLSTQEYGNPASVISKYPEVRTALFDAQRNMIKTPGLVAEGRDMCTKIFTDAKVKIYLDASLDARAMRRHLEEIEKETSKTLEQIKTELAERDHRDSTREEGRLYPAEDAIIVDTTNMKIEEVFDRCVKACEEKGIKKVG